MKSTFPKVLVIDDDKPFGEALSRWLFDLGYRPAMATSAAEGVAMLEQGAFDAVLLDLQLPDLSGHAVIRQLKQAGIELPVIVISGTTEMDDIVRAWREDAADFLRKPFRIDDLSTALDRALKPRGLADPAAVGGPTTSETTSPSVRSRSTVATLVASVKAGAVRLPILDPGVGLLPELLTTQNWNIDQLADTLSRDSNLAAGILHTANSVAYSRGKELTSMRDACALLGTRTVIAVAFEITVEAQFTIPREPYRTAMKSSWRNAVVASRVAPLVGEMLRRTDCEDLRLATLFHNIGELVALSLLAELDSPSDAAITRAQLAVDLAGTHEDLGAALASSWGLPALAIRIAGHHHHPSGKPEPTEEKLARNLVLGSWAIALRAGFTYFPGQGSVDPGAAFEVLGLSEKQLGPVYEKIKTWRVDA